jgi:hypothetical protein
MVTPEQAKRFAAFFSGRVSSYGSYAFNPATNEKKTKTVSEPLPPDAYEKHLNGDGPFLGIIMIREDNTCLFAAIDIDDDGIDHDELEAKIVAHNLPLVVCRSKSGGAHAYLFLREPVGANIVVDALKKFRTVLGHEKNSNGTPVEIFPKQVKLMPGQVGNWINLPYYGHETTNRYAVTGTRRLSLDEFFEHAVRRSTDESGLLEWVDPALGPFGDGPPCLQSLHKQDFPEGTRNTGLLNVGLFYKISQPGSWEEALREYNTNMESPVEESELRQIIKNLGRHDYAYTCKIHPLEGLCKKKECKKQPFGIGFFAKQKRLASLPELSNMVKIDTDPPRYRLSVNNIPLQCSLDQILTPIQFKRLVFEKLNLVVGRVKEPEWDEILRTLTDSSTTEEAPAEAGDKGLLLVYVSDFLQTRHKSDSLDDILLGRAARENGRVYFRGVDLAAFLQRRQFRRYSMNELYTVLKEMAKLETAERTLKGASVSLWSVPEPTDEQSEPFDHPIDRTVKAY